MGGETTLDSVYGQASTITARIPLSKASSSSGFPHLPNIPTHALNGNHHLPITEPTEPSHTVRRNLYKVLLADDNDLLREILFKTLTRMDVRRMILSPASSHFLICSLIATVCLISSA